MITGIIRNAAPVSDELIDKARRMAWKAHAKHRGRREFWNVHELGAGHFSKVYKLADGLVLKVGGPGGYGFDGRGMHYYDYDNQGAPISDAWPKYVEWTASMKRRPSWAPKVHHLEQLVGRVYFAIVEELTPHNDTLHRSHHLTAAPCKIIASVGNSLGLRDDMHSGNFMWRKSNGRMTPVITDPWCTRTGGECY